MVHTIGWESVRETFIQNSENEEEKEKKEEMGKWGGGKNKEEEDSCKYLMICDGAQHPAASQQKMWHEEPNKTWHSTFLNEQHEHSQSFFDQMNYRITIFDIGKKYQ